MQTKLKDFPKNKLWCAICSSSLAMTWLMTASVVQASDLQIYAAPNAGQKTVILMLDTSGSMGVNVNSNSINADYSVCSDRRTVSSDTGGSGSYTYPRTYCSVAYSATASSNYQRLKNRCFNPGNNGALKCYDRLSRLKDGMFALLDSSDADVTAPNERQIKLSNTYVGLGNFSADGDNKTGQILVAAKPLGAVGSAQRNLIKSKLTGLSAQSSTPSAHAMAEAASYLLGTTTYSEQTYIIQKERYRKRVQRSNNATSYSTCTNNSSNIDLDNQTQSCRNNGWSSWGTTAPSGIGSATQTDYDSDSTYYYYYYSEPFTHLVVNADSGTPKSKANDTTDNPDIVMSRTATNVTAQYKSPLPATSSSCDGQGVYFLSDGQPNNSSNDQALTVMQKALDASGSTFQCNIDLPNSVDDYGNDVGSAWNCMGAFAKALFDPTKNPKNRSIKTAFVGFGKEFESNTVTSGTDTDIKNACKISSRAYSVRGTPPNDKCSPGGGRTVTVPSPTSQETYDGGFGNGGFYQASSPSDVTNSVVDFIRGLGDDSLAPITTGNIIVPYDTLTPNKLSEYGYLRAFEPDPANNPLTWRGNLKRYRTIMTSGSANLGAFADRNGRLVYQANGNFETNTKDYWNDSTYNDDKLIHLGGAYSKVPLPFNGQAQLPLTGSPITQYAYTASSKIRNLFTDVESASSSGLTETAIPASVPTAGVGLLQIPAKPTDGSDPYSTSISATASYVLDKFSAAGQAILKDFPIDIKLKLLNYLGYPVNLASTVLPSTLTTSDAPYLSMGGSIHSMPLQLTYSGTLDASGNLTSAREQSILYGSMEGGLHIVNASTGEEQMVFVPAEILKNSATSKALVVGQVDANAPAHGVDGSWVADSAYNTMATTTTSGSTTTTTTKVTARRMNIYGGLRMGGDRDGTNGNSYYGLNVLNPKSPKLLFRINKGTSGFSRLGQTWSKPVLTNVRYGGQIKRVMIVGGGYDQCYEDPTFTLVTSGNNSTCATKAQAQGNAVYMIDAKTGALLWSATYSAGATDGQQYMKHSIVSRISTLDRDADGLTDHLYFGDLGGQVFRADLNNAASTTSSFGVRVVRLANMATNDTTNDNGNDYTGAKAPRFYEPVTVTIHDEGNDTFILVGLASGNRSTPLDVSPTIGREGMTPATALTGQPVNNVYGVIDRDFSNRNLMTATYASLLSKDKTRADFKKNPQILATGGNVAAFFFPQVAGSTKDGWYRSLSSQSSSTTAINSVEKADGTFRKKGGLKAFEEPFAITNNLLIPVYDPEGTGVAQQDPCLPRIIGETDWQKYCLPYGACTNSDGTLNINSEVKSGFQTTTQNCPGNATECNSNVIGGGIRGLAFVPKPETSGSGSCGKFAMAGNTKGTGEWQCTSRLVQTRWYERR
ncbi:pilus assembly protein PilY [Acinetobacter sp. Z1]|uniref:pilus assembly protein PilY n=1 Tax=Acinetobacter sp. Z1 TaxID=2953738 RepID=UPI0020CA038B|nr:pilus assembly protein PilY [Acinetobacter sp. Z1]UTO19859.1 pilus assembly protein PilY [Acinetobacter sp. Z1]